MVEEIEQCAKQDLIELFISVLHSKSPKKDWKETPMAINDPSGISLFLICLKSNW